MLLAGAGEEEGGEAAEFDEGAGTETGIEGEAIAGLERERGLGDGERPGGAGAEPALGDVVSSAGGLK